MAASGASAPLTGGVGPVAGLAGRAGSAPALAADEHLGGQLLVGQLLLGPTADVLGLGAQVLLPLPTSASSPYSLPS